MRADSLGHIYERDLRFVADFLDHLSEQVLADQGIGTAAHDPQLDLHFHVWFGVPRILDDERSDSMERES